MKLAFSTLGCPEWSWVDIQAMARDLGFDGIEIRGLGQEIQAAKVTARRRGAAFPGFSSRSSSSCQAPPSAAIFISTPRCLSWRCSVVSSMRVTSR